MKEGRRTGGKNERMRKGGRKVRREIGREDRLTDRRIDEWTG